MIYYALYTFINTEELFMNAPVIREIALLTVERFLKIYGKKDERYELIDGVPYMMAAPNTAHQALSMFLSVEIGNYLKGKKCRIFAAPYDVFLSESSKAGNGGLSKYKKAGATVVQPDLLVICDKDKIKPEGCCGVPDFVIEIMSASTKDKDERLKLYKYLSSGVKEYWLIDPEGQTIQVYHKPKAADKKAALDTFTFSDMVTSHVLDGLEIDFAQFGF